MHKHKQCMSYFISDLLKGTDNNVYLLYCLMLAFGLGASVVFSVLDGLSSVKCQWISQRSMCFHFSRTITNQASELKLKWKNKRPTIIAVDINKVDIRFQFTWSLPIVIEETLRFSLSKHAKHWVSPHCATLLWKKN